MDDASTAVLWCQGWQWFPGGGEDTALRLARSVYGTDRLVMRSRLAPATAPSVGGGWYALGNPIETAQWVDWLMTNGSWCTQQQHQHPTPIPAHARLVRRIWFTALAAGDVLTLASGTELLRRGQVKRSSRIPLRWTTRPHITGPMRAPCRGAPVFGADCDGLLVAPDGLMVECEAAERV